jgi:hypothetical protein
MGRVPFPAGNAANDPTEDRVLLAVLFVQGRDFLGGKEERQLEDWDHERWGSFTFLILFFCDKPSDWIFCVGVLGLTW